MLITIYSIFITRGVTFKTFSRDVAYNAMHLIHNWKKKETRSALRRGPILSTFNLRHRTVSKSVDFNDNVKDIWTLVRRMMHYEIFIMIFSNSIRYQILGIGIGCPFTCVKNIG